MSGLAVIILLGRFWKRSTWQGALAALITTPAVSLALMAVPGVKKHLGDPTIPATLAGSLAHVVISLLTPPPRCSFEEVAEALSRERQAIEGESPVISHQSSVISNQSSVVSYQLAVST